MFNKVCIKFLTVAVCCSILFTSDSLCINSAVAEPAGVVQTSSAVIQSDVRPLNVVNAPKAYLNKKITMNTKFDKFSTLGLDYKPALRSSENYISFLIKRDDTMYDIPLSEMKLFLKRDVAEKYINLKTNDEIKVTGTVFSDALGDAWVDVEEITVTKKAPEKDGVK